MMQGTGGGRTVRRGNQEITTASVRRDGADAVKALARKRSA